MSDSVPFQQLEAHAHALARYSLSQNLYEQAGTVSAAFATLIEACTRLSFEMGHG
jgi:hypothetical protein